MECVIIFRQQLSNLSIFLPFSPSFSSQVGNDVMLKPQDFWNFYFPSSWILNLLDLDTPSTVVASASSPYISKVRYSYHFILLFLLLLSCQKKSCFSGIHIINTLVAVVPIFFYFGRCFEKLRLGCMNNNRASNYTTRTSI